jgi:transcriptional regulator with XRE-family HTH domain
MPRRRRDPEPIARVFGEAVRDRREKHAWSLDELAERMGSQDGRYLGELERGFHSPTLTMAKRIADALDVPLVELVKDL